MLFTEGGGILYNALTIGGAAAMTMALLFAPVNSGCRKAAGSANAELAEEIGWPDLVESVAQISAGLPAEERARTGILTGN